METGHALQCEIWHMDGSFWKGMVKGMKIIQGKQAVVMQVRTTTALQGRTAAVTQVRTTTASQENPAAVRQIRTTTASQREPAMAVCHGVIDPVYQKPHYHSVHPVAEQEAFLAFSEEGMVEGTERDMPVPAVVREADAAEPVIEDRYLETGPKEMTLQELFQQEK